MVNLFMGKTALESRSEWDDLSQMTFQNDQKSDYWFRMTV